MMASASDLSHAPLKFSPPSRASTPLLPDPSPSAAAHPTGDDSATPAQPEPDAFSLASSSTVKPSLAAPPPPALGDAFHYHEHGGFAPGPMTPAVEPPSMPTAGPSSSATTSITRPSSPPSTLFANLLTGSGSGSGSGSVSGTGVHPGMANGKPGGGDCRRLCNRHQRMAHEGTNRQLQIALESMSSADQEAVNTVWTLFSSSHASRRKLMLQGLLTICCPSQLSFLSESMKHVCRIDPFLVLPREISLKILGFVDAISLGRAAQVSRTWQKLADDDLLWRTMCQQHIERKCEKCGWGLPLMEKRRRHKAATINAGASTGTTKSDRPKVALSATVSSIGGEKARVLAGAAAVGTVCVASGSTAPSTPVTATASDRSDRPTKRVRLTPRPSTEDLQSQSPLVSPSSPVHPSRPESPSASVASTTTRPWKTVYTERFALEKNWRKGTCNVSVFAGHTDAITCLQVEECMPSVAFGVMMTGSWDRTVKVWNLDTGECMATLNGHARGVRCLRFDSAKLITGSMDATMKIWNWRTGSCLRTISGHTDAVVSLTYDDELLVSGSADSSVRVWNFTTGAGFVLRGHREWVNSVALWSPESGCAPTDGAPATSQPAAMDVDAAAGTSSVPSSPPSDRPHKLLFSGSDDGTIRVWDLVTRDCVRVLEGHVAQVQSIKVISIEDEHSPHRFALPPNGKNGGGRNEGINRSQVTIGNNYEGFFEEADLARPDGTAAPFVSANQTTGGPPAAHYFRQAASLTAPTNLAPLDFGGPGTARPLLVSGSLDNCVKVWDLEKGSCARTMFGHIEGVWSVDADRLRIVSASHDRSLKIWDRATGRCMHTLVGHRGAVTSVSLADDKIVTGSDDGDVRVWSFF